MERESRNQHFFVPCAQMTPNTSELKDLIDPKIIQWSKIAGCWYDSKQLQRIMPTDTVMQRLLQRQKNIVECMAHYSNKNKAEKPPHLDRDDIYRTLCDAKFDTNQQACHLREQLLRPERDLENMGFLKIYGPEAISKMEKTPVGTWLVHLCLIKHAMFVRDEDEMFVPFDRVFQVTWKNVSSVDCFFIVQTPCWGWYEWKDPEQHVAPMISQVAFHDTFYSLLEEHIPNFKKSKMFRVLEPKKEMVGVSLSFSSSPSSSFSLSSSSCFSSSPSSSSCFSSSPSSSSCFSSSSFSSSPASSFIPSGYRACLELVASALKSSTEDFLTKFISPQKRLDLATIVRQDLKAAKEWMCLIYGSREYPSLEIAASNIITVLNVAGLGFSGCDFSGVRIPRANLNGGVFHKTNFQRADLTNTSFFQAHLQGACFDGALMKNIDFGQTCPVQVSHFCLNCMAVSPNGRIMVIGTRVGEIHIMDWFKRLCLFHQESGPIHDIQISADGKYLAYTYNNTWAAVWNIENLSEKKKVWQHRFSCSRVSLIAFSPSVHCLAIASDVGVTICNIANPDPDNWAFITPLKAADIKKITGMLWLSNEEIVTCDTNKKVMIWTNGKSSSLSFNADVEFSAMARNRCLLALAGTNAGENTQNVVWIYDLKKKQSLKCIKTNHAETITKICFALMGTCIVTASNDYTAKVWSLTPYDKKKDEPLATLMGHSEGITGVTMGVFLSDLLATCSQDGTIRFWSLASEQHNMRLKVHDAEITKVLFFPDGQSFLSASEDGSILEWPLDSGTYKQIYECNRKVHDISMGRKNLFWSCDEKKIQLWQQSNPTPIWSIAYEHWKVNQVKQMLFLQDHNLLITSSHLFIGETILWKIVDQKVVSQHSLCKESMSCLTATKDQKVVFMGTAKGQIYSFSVQEERLTCLQNIKLDVYSLSLTIDGKHLAVACKGYESRVIVSPLENMQDKGYYYFNHKRFTFVTAIHPTASLVACGSRDGSITFWKLQQEKKHLHCFVAHAGTITTLAFSPDGSHLISGGRDAAIKVWNVAPLLEKTETSPVLVWCTHSSLNIAQVSIKDAQELGYYNEMLLRLDVSK